MVATITLTEDDSAIALAAMLSALDSTDTLTPHEEMVVERVTEACFEDLHPDHIDLVDEQAEDILDRITS